MPIINRIADFHAELTEWRRELHQHPGSPMKSTGPDFVAKKLEEIGVEVHQGLGKTGVVGKLVGQSDSGQAMGFARIWTRCQSMRRMTFRTNPSIPERCMLVAMTGTPPCCSGPPSTWPRHELRWNGLLCFPACRRGWGRREAMVKTGCSRSSIARRSGACTTGPACLSDRSRSRRGR